MMYFGVCKPLLPSLQSADDPVATLVDEVSSERRVTCLGCFVRSTPAISEAINLAYVNPRRAHADCSGRHTSFHPCPGG